MARNKGGRPLKPESQKQTERLFVQLTKSEKNEFMKHFQSSKMKCKNDFVKAAIFNKEVTVLVKDRNSEKFLVELANLKNEYNRIGVNINQTTRKINALLSGEERKAYAYLKEMNASILQLATCNMKIEKLVIEFGKKIFK